MSKMVLRLLIFSVFITCCWECAAAAVAPSFRGLGFLPDSPAGSLRSEAYSVSADGSAVAGFSSAPNGFQAFRWTVADGMAGLGTLSSAESYSDAVAISADGTAIVGKSRLGATMVAYQWTHAAGMSPIAFPLPTSHALAVSADGSFIAGYYSPSFSSRIGFRWSAATGRQDFNRPDLGNTFCQPNGISADGSVVVGTVGDAPQRAFIWDPVTGLRLLNELSSGTFTARSASAVTPDAQWAVGTGYEEAFRWSPASGFQTFGSLANGVVMDRAFAVSADGNVVVGDGLISTSGEAMIWRLNGGLSNLRNYLTDEVGLQMEGWSLDFASGISADGRVIVGTGVNPDGHKEAWIAVVPEPFEMSCTIGALVLLRRRRSLQK